MSCMEHICHVICSCLAMQYLLDHDASVNACDKHGDTPLHVACSTKPEPAIMDVIHLLVRVYINVFIIILLSF